MRILCGRHGVDRIAVETAYLHRFTQSDHDVIKILGYLSHVHEDIITVGGSISVRLLSALSISASSRENLSSGFLTSSNTSQP